MPTPANYHFDLPTAGRPEDVSFSEFWYPGVKDYWERCTSSRKFDPIMGVRAIVVHATAGGSSEGAISVMRDGHASFHWLVPDEDEPAHGKNVWACAPEARAAWHVQNTKSHPAINGGADRANLWSLGIEVVNRQTGNDPFSAWQIQATAQIVRYCWAKYPNLRHVVSHAKLDPKRRSDPGVGFPWEKFQQLVLTGSGDGVPRSVLSTPRASTITRGIAPNSCCMP